MPSAPTLTAQLTNARFGMTTTGVYKYWLSNKTKYGQTVISASPLTVTLTGSNNGAQLALPAATASAYNPVVGRVLYRSTNGGSTALWVADLDAVGVGTVTDGRADSELGDAAPSSDTSGISPSPVTVVGPGAVTWTERPQGTALSGLDYTVDYSSTATGGLVTFAAADAGKVVTITYTAATLLTDAPLNAIITAAGLGVRQIVEGVQGGAGGLLTSSSVVDWPGTPTVTITPSAGGRLRVRFVNKVLIAGTVGAVVLLTFYASVDGVTTSLWQANPIIPAGSAAYIMVYGEVVVAAIADVAHAVKVQATISSQSAQQNATAGTVVLIVEEVA